MLRRRGLSVASLALLALVGAGIEAQGEYFEISTSVTISPVNAIPSAPPSTVTAGSQSFTSGSYTRFVPTSTFDTDGQPGGNQVTLIGLDSNPSPPHINAQGQGSDIVFGNIDPNINTLGAAIEAIAFNYTFKLTLYDYPTAGAASPMGIDSFMISGRISGNLGSNQVNLQNSNFAISPALLRIGGADYTVTNLSYTPGGLDNNGVFGAHVSSTPSVPEPGTLALVGLGGAILGLRAWRRRRAR